MPGRSGTFNHVSGEKEVHVARQKDGTTKFRIVDNFSGNSFDFDMTEEEAERMAQTLSGGQWRPPTKPPAPKKKRTEKEAEAKPSTKSGTCEICGGSGEVPSVLGGKRLCTDCPKEVA